MPALGSRRDLEVRGSAVAFNPPVTVYGIGQECTWIDPIDQAVALIGGYACPYCGGVVAAVRALELRIDAEAQQQTRPYLYEFLAWCRGKCYPRGSQRALAHFEHDLGISREVMCPTPAGSA